MNFKDITEHLSPEQKKRLKNAKTKEELDEVFTSEKMMLTDDQLGEVAGGAGGCFLPKHTCARCGWTGYFKDSKCGVCGWQWGDILSLEEGPQPPDPYAPQLPERIL